jgi:hypothetical protein
MPKRKTDKDWAKNPLDKNSQKGRRGPKPTVIPRIVRGRAENYRALLANYWDRLWPRLSHAQIEQDVLTAFREFGLGEQDPMPHLAGLILQVLQERMFPKRRQARINFVADSIAGLGRVSARRSRDICTEERARAKQAHHIVRYEYYVECSCGYNGPSTGHACLLCGAKIIFPGTFGYLTS